MAANNAHKVHKSSVVIEADLLAELRTMAAQHDRSLAGEIRRAVRLYVESNRNRRTELMRSQGLPESVRTRT